MQTYFKNKYNLSLFAAGTVSLLFYYGFSLFQTGRSIELYMVLYAVQFFIMALVYYFLQGVPEVKRSQIYTILAFAVLFRVALIPSDISTSDDVYRYIWEGKLTLNGENPFLYPPESDKLDYLHTEEYPDIVSYPNMTSIYPAAAQAVFALGYLISGESLTGLKLIYLLSEILTLYALLILLRLRKSKQSNLILYAWLPLPIMEFFINAHIDVVGIAFVMLSILFLYKNKPLLSAALFALAVSVKLYALIMLPFVIHRIGWKRGMIYIAQVVIIFIITMLGFVSAKERLFASLIKYGSSWSFNGGVYPLLEALLSNGYLAHALSFLLLAITLLFLFIKKKLYLKGMYFAWITYIVFAPALYPWYLGWIAALVPFFPFRSILAFLFLVNFSNFSPLQNEWQEFLWVYLIEYIPFFVLLYSELKKNADSNAEKKRRYIP